MVKKYKKGFTLVELLAVIVILAIILVIAVPQIMKTIDNAREGAFASSAKLIAASAEREYLVRKTLGDTSFEELKTIPCSDVVEENKEDYGNCTIEFDVNGKATVSLEGKGKFAGKNVCEGTRTEAIVGEESCSGVKLTIDLDGGSVTVNKEGRYEPGTILALVSPTKEGLGFTEWTITSGEGATVKGNVLTIGEEPVTVKANYVTPTMVSTEAELNEVLEDGGYAMLSNNLSVSASMPGFNSVIFDGNNKNVTSDVNIFGDGKNYSGIIKNATMISAANAFRYAPIGQSDLIIDNSFIEGKTYALHHNISEGGNLYVTNSTINGWITVVENVESMFVNVNFSKGNSNYSNMNVYGNLMLVDCNFEDDYIMNIANSGNVTFINSKYNGQLITEENVATLFDFNETEMTGVVVRNT